MNFAQLNAFGIPSQVVDCIEGEEPGAPEAGEVLVEMLACPINPAELLIIEGRYASKPPLPARSARNWQGLPLKRRSPRSMVT